VGWETRNGKKVYYRKERFVDASGRRRVRSVYVGAGERGELAAREDAERRSARVAPGESPEEIEALSPSALLGFDDALAHVRRAGCGPSALYAQGRVDVPTYLRLLAVLKTS
jgi:hypothetical protein